MGALAGAGFRASACQETGAAKNGATLRRIEGNGRLLAALGALHGDLYTLAYPRSLGCGDGRQSFVLGLLAWLAALGLVPQSLVLKKELLARRPDKTLSAIDAVERAVFELRFGMAPFAVRAARHLYLCHDENPPTDKRFVATGFGG
jgi:hypothetical protein